MKKIKLVLFTIICMFSYLVVDAEGLCKPSREKELREQVAKFSINYEIAPKGTFIEEHISPGETIKKDYSYKIKITPESLPDNFYAMITSDGVLYGILSGTTPIYVDKGGVYNIQIYNYECGPDFIKKFDLMIPIYNKDNKKEGTWFDGTYEQKGKKDDSSQKSKLKLGLIITIIILLIIIIGTAFFLYKKRRPK